MKKFLYTILTLVILACIVGGIGYYYVLIPNTTVTDNGIIYIEHGTTFNELCKQLSQKQYLKNESTFRFCAKLKKYTIVKSGCFRIKNGMNNNELINILRSGQQAEIRFTFNNIRTIDQFAGVAARQLEFDSLSLIKELNNQKLIDSLGFTKETFIGMFVPNTYKIYWNITPHAFILRMNDEYQKFWTAERLQKAQNADITPMGAITIASIIEEETIKNSEFPIIAGVYLNRLKKGMPLEACPTLKYAWNDFTIRRILLKHQEIDSPYNTYRNIGLPPGPIRMPSINVIDAVLNYQHHDYLFFCAKSDFSGSHNFSSTLRQHNKYAEEYHKALNQKKIY